MIWTVERVFSSAATRSIFTNLFRYEYYKLFYILNLLWSNYYSCVLVLQTFHFSVLRLYFHPLREMFAKQLSDFLFATPRISLLEILNFSSGTGNVHFWHLHPPSNHYKLYKKLIAKFKWIKKNTRMIRNEKLLCDYLLVVKSANFFYQ